MESPEIVVTSGESPRFWQDRSAIFVANLLSLFFGNRGEAYALEKQIEGVDTYGGRLLPITSLIFEGGDNLLVLERQPDAALEDYFRKTLRLPLPRTVCLTYSEYLGLLTELVGSEGGAPEGVFHQLRQHPAPFMDGFVTDPGLASLADALGKKTISSTAGSYRGNNKFLLHRALESAGLPTFETLMASSAEDVQQAAGELGTRGFETVAVKAQLGASGIGLTRIPAISAPVSIPASFFHEGPCMVQGWITPGQGGVREIHSPSVQMFVSEDTVVLYDMTEQILSGAASVHEGNVSPPPYLDQMPGLAEELLRQAGIAGRWLHGQGYRGTASTDFLVASDASPAGFTAYVCEINARVTGATYPSVLARRFFPRGAWLMRNLMLSVPVPGKELLDILARSGILFTGSEPTAILPINFNLTDDELVEKGQFLCLAPTTAECFDLLQRAESSLPIDWSYITDR